MRKSGKKRSRADEVYDQLRFLIVTLALEPGEVLLERDLCAKFSVSRTPVREATLRLAEHGLVVIAPQHATYVAGIDARAVRQAHFLRSNLELPVIRLLCHQQNLDLTLARSILDQQQQAMRDAEFIEFIPLDDQFHHALFILAGMGELWSVIHARKAHLDRIRFLQAPTPGKIPLLVNEHETILNAIERRDEERAERTLRGHIAGAVLYMEELLLLQPELFFGRLTPE
ncbi:MAG TPA: GntR family transcriptional regulator [Devosia sp.]|jgi:DNA-binding GntR family transcriptional regulator|nr:GntR family transcriptional regulator [Devosia sp.]